MAIKVAWLHNRVITDSFRKSERLIYERSLRKDVALAQLWQPDEAPSACAVALALGGLVAALGVPVWLLLVYGTDLGPRGSWSFLLNFFWEFVITYFLVAPLSLLWIKIFLPSLLVEHLRKVDHDHTRPQYPYATPCPQTPLEFLLDLDPTLEPLVDAYRRQGAPAAPAAPTASTRSRPSLAAPQLGAGPPLEVLEAI